MIDVIFQFLYEIGQEIIVINLAIGVITDFENNHLILKFDILLLVWRIRIYNFDVYLPGATLIYAESKFEIGYEARGYPSLYADITDTEFVEFLLIIDVVS